MLVLEKKSGSVSVFCFLLVFQDCFILDNKGSSVMVWKGKKASKEERQGAMNRALVCIQNDDCKDLLLPPVLSYKLIVSILILFLLK